MTDAAKTIALNVLASLDVDGATRLVLTREGDSLVAGDGRYDLGSREVVLIGFGKASLRMGQAVEQTLGDRISSGVLVSDRRHKIEVRSEVIVAGHPVPNENSLLAGRRILELVEEAEASSLIIFLISGGGSALVESPVSSRISLADLREMNRVLVESGATIREINLVRKHLSAIKGGRLGELVGRRDCLAFYISDVNPGDLLSIASNPLLPDPAGLDEFYWVTERYDLAKKLPGTVANLIRNRDIRPLPFGPHDGSRRLESQPGTGENASAIGEQCEPGGSKVWWMADSLKNPEDKGESSAANWFRCGNIAGAVLMENQTALASAAEAGRLAGFNATILPDLIEGRYQDIADAMINRLVELRSRGESGPVCLISGGEVLCPVRGTGTGGRNQEFVLYSGAKLASRLPGQNVCILSCGSDGIDGNSPAAGAVIDSGMIQDAMRAGVKPEDFIARNDSFTFFKAAGGLIVTGPTGNNVRDIRVLLSA